MRNKKSLVLGICLFVLSVAGVRSAKAATLEVGISGYPYTSIQAAINDAVSGVDEVLVHAGTYVENIDFLGKAITVYTNEGATIDGNQNGSVVTIDSGEDANTVLDGFTITNGRGSNDYGGGIYCLGSSPTISNCIITGNSAGLRGGGIFCFYSSPTITGCTITNNSASDNNGSFPQNNGGGGIYCKYVSTPTVINCVISDNSAEGPGYAQGGGIFCDNDSTITISDSTISGNSSNHTGGGMAFWQFTSATITNCTITNNEGMIGGGIATINATTLTITDCTIDYNSASSGGSGIYLQYTDPVVITNSNISNNTGNASGGGINCYESSLSLNNCSIIDNETFANSGGGIFFVGFGEETSSMSNCTVNGNISKSTGGGVYIVHQQVTITNCTFNGNVANYWLGGAIFISNSPSIIQNSTFSGNSADYGGAIACSYGPSIPTVVNSILWADIGTVSANEIYTNHGASIDITYSDIQGGWTGTGNIDADPLFVDAANGDYHLSVDSPGIDAGDNTAPNLPSTDFEGDDRVVNFVVDMGADEFSAEVIIEPDTIDVTRNNPNIKCYIELPEGNAADIDESTILLEGTIPVTAVGALGDKDADGIPDLKVRFDRASVNALLTQDGETTLTVDGNLTDGTPFTGLSIVTVVGNGQ